MNTIKVYISFILLLVVNFSYAQSFNTIFPYKAANNKWGYCDENNKTIVAPKFAFAELHQNGFAKVINDKDQHAIINDKGAFIIPFGDYLISTGKNESIFEFALDEETEGVIPTLDPMSELEEESNDYSSEVRDNVFVVIKEKERVWYNGSGEVLFTDNFDYDLTIKKVRITEELTEHFYILKNSVEEKITIINKHGKIIAKDIPAFECYLIDMYLEEKTEVFFTFYKGSIKENAEDFSDYNSYYHYRRESPYQMHKQERDNLACQLIDVNGKVIIPYGRSLVSIDEVNKRQNYYANRFSEGYLEIIELISDADDCEPTDQYGLYGIGSQKEIVTPAFDDLSYIGSAYERQAYNTLGIHAENNILLNEINSNKTFDDFYDFTMHIESLINDESMGQIDENASEEFNGFKGIFAFFNNEDKTLVYKIEKGKSDFFKQIDEDINVYNIYYQNGDYYCNYRDEYSYTYNLTTGEKKRAGESEFDEEDNLKGTEFELFQNEEGMYSLKNNKNEIIESEIEKYEMFNNNHQIVFLHKDEKIALIPLNKKVDNIEFQYHAIFKPNPKYGDLTYATNNLYEEIEALIGEMEVSEQEIYDMIQQVNTEFEVPVNNQQVANDSLIYPQIVVSDKGFGAINENGEFIIPIQDNVLIFENFGGKKMIGAYQLKASVVNNKQNMGYYSLEGEPYFE